MSIRYKIGKKLLQPLGPLYRAYVSKPRSWSYKGVKLVVPPGVFPPFLTGSTKTMMDFISSLKLSESRALEIGVGSGAITIYAAKLGAFVDGVDISELALKSTRENCDRNNVKCELYFSDLLDNVRDQELFDFIFINPPYYPKKPSKIDENAWYCGEDFEYFAKCFSQLKERNRAKTYMVLSNDCELDKIQEIAAKNELQLSEVFSRKNFTNIHIVYQILPLE